MDDESLYIRAKDLITFRESSNDNDENLTDEFKRVEQAKENCRICNNPVVEEGYELALCSECRDKLSKRKIPLGIKLLALLCLIAIIAMLPKFPPALNAAIEYERGVKAEKALKYFSAVKQYEKVAKKYPKSDGVLVKLFSSYYHNGEIDKAYNTYKKLMGAYPESKELDDDLKDVVNVTIYKMDNYYLPKNDLYMKLKNIKGANPKTLIKIVKPFVVKNNNEVFGAYILAKSYFEIGKFNEANKILNKIMLNNSDFYLGRVLQAYTYSELGQYNKAIEETQKILRSNVEDTKAIVLLSKIEFKRGNKGKYLEYAKKAIAIDEKNPYSIANLSLAYHYNNKFKERDKYLKRYKLLKDKEKFTEDLLTSIYSSKLNAKNK